MSNEHAKTEVAHADKKERMPNDFRLFRQAAMNAPKLAEEMIREHPDLLRAKDFVGETPLHYCAVEGATDAVRWLLAQRASVDPRTHSEATPLMNAAQLGHYEVCRLLVDAGADVNAKDNNADSPLHFAALSGRLDICKLLLESKARADVENSTGERPWDLALPRKREAVHDLLRKYGGEPPPKKPEESD